MKKTLYYLAQILLVISTLFVGFVTSTEMMILCVSCLITGCLLMLVYALSSEKNFCAFFLYGMAASAHFFYLFALQSFAPILLCVLALMMLCTAACLIWKATTSGLPPISTLIDVLFTKTALLPEIVLNFLMKRATSDFMFEAFSWILLGITSAYVFVLLVQLVKAKKLDRSKAIAAGVVQLCFFTDILSTVWLLIYLKRQKNQEKKAEKEQEALLEKKKESSMLKRSSMKASGHGARRSAQSPFAPKKKEQ